jgi:hypothetical protein
MPEYISNTCGTMLANCMACYTGGNHQKAALFDSRRTTALASAAHCGQA